MLCRFRRNNTLPQDTATQRIRYERIFKTIFCVGQQFFAITALLLARRMGQYCFACCRRLYRCRRAGQLGAWAVGLPTLHDRPVGYIPLGRHLVVICNHFDFVHRHSLRDQ